jgi:quinol monooxygenase YgiN
MIVAQVSVKIKEDVAPEFEQVAREVVGAVRQMPGCVKNEWYPVPDAPRRYDFYGEFDSKENFESYLQSAAVKRIGDELMPLLDGPPAFKHFEAVVFESS